MLLSLHIDQGELILAHWQALEWIRWSTGAVPRQTDSRQRAYKKWQSIQYSCEGTVTYTERLLSWKSEGSRSTQRLSLQSLDSKASTHTLHVGVGRILQVLVRNAETVSRIADAVTVDADIQRFRHPRRRHTCLKRANPPRAVRRLPTVPIHVARQVRLVFRVSNQNYTFDGVERIPGQTWQCIARSSRTLGVALENEACVGVGSEGRLDLIDDVGRSRGRVLRIVGRVDSVILGTARDGGEDTRVHGAEARGGSLRLTSAASVDDDVAGAAGTLLDGICLNCASSGEEEGGEGRLEKHCG